jgi:hypothetical protein
MIGGIDAIEPPIFEIIDVCERQKQKSILKKINVRCHHIVALNADDV